MAATTTITVGTIVNDVILMISDDSYLNGAKNYHIKYLATQALKEFSFDLMKDVKSTELTVANNGTITLPDDYIKYTKSMINKNIRVNNEFYVCPVYNEALKDKKNIVIHNIKKMWGLGTPDDLENFKNKFFS